MFDVDIIRWTNERTNERTNEQTGSFVQDKLNRLKREALWIDTLDILEPIGSNKIKYEDILKEVEVEEMVSFVVPFFSK